MLKSKLIQFIDTFERSEYSNFSKFVRSPFFNNKKEVARLFDYIYDIKKNKKSRKKNLLREKAFQSVFPNETFDARRMQLLMSELMSVVKEYFIIKELKSKEVTSKKLLLKSYNYRNLTESFNDEIQSLIHKINVQPSVEEHLDLFYLYQDLHLYAHDSKLDVSIINTEVAHKHLNIYYLLTYLHLSSELINRNVTFDQQKEVLLFERVEEVLTSKIKKESPLFKIYLLLIDLLKNDFKSHKFSQLEKSFFKHQSLLTPKKKLDLFLLMINILSRQFNLGNKKIAKKIFTLCQKGLSSKILLYNNRISQEAFTNIISISCFLEKTKWGESFIKKYENFLPEEKKENAVKFGNGSLSFSKAEYEEAVFYLSNHSLDRSFFDIRAKFLLIKALYEMFHSSNEASIKRLLNAIEAFLKYIERKKIGEEKKIFYQNFAKYIRGIVKDKIRNLPLKELSKKWTNKIQNEDKIYGKVWLLKKVNLKNLKKKVLLKE